MPSPTEVIDDLITGMNDWRGDTLAKLRKIVYDADPAIIEEMKWKRPSNPASTPTFEHNGIVCIVVILKERVRLTFGAGSSLPDPKHLFNAQLNGKSRAIDFYKGDMLDEASLRAMIRKAVEINLAKVKPAESSKR